MVNYWLMAFKKYADFEGRARRSEYWYYTLMNIILMVSLQILIFVCAASDAGIVSAIFGILYFIYALATLIPSLAVAVRRLHDIGKSGWMILVGLIPLVGGIWLIVLMATDSQEGSNEYGQNPKTWQEDLINKI